MVIIEFLTLSVTCRLALIYGGNKSESSHPRRFPRGETAKSPINRPDLILKR